MSAQERVTLTISATAVTIGAVTNTAIFSGTEVLTETAHLLIYGSQTYLPLVLKR